MKNVMHKKRSLKGSVLFTVLCVLAVVMVLILATISLAGVASKRAYAEYQDTQVVSTGKSIIQSILPTLAPGNINEDLGDEIYKDILSKSIQSPPDKTPYTVYLANGGHLGNGLGTVEKIEFSFAGKDALVDKSSNKILKDGDYYAKGNGYIIMKVTATINMGTESTTYTEYVTDVTPGSSGSGGGDGGLLTSGAIELEGTGSTVLGPFGGGINSMKAANKELTLKNQGIFFGSQMLNNSIKLNVKKLFLYDANTPATSYEYDKGLRSANYQGLTVLGDLKFDSDGVSFMSKDPQTDDTRVPYVFVTGEINYGNCAVSIGTTLNDTPNKSNISSSVGNRVNLYCGNLVFGNQLKNVNAVSDIYCYNENKTSVFGGQKSSPLLNWIEEVRANNNINSNTIKGNVYTKGNLKLKSTALCIDGDLYVGGKLDLSDLTSTNDAEIPSVTGKICVVGDVVKPSPEPTANSKYNEFIGKITNDSIVFPAEKELETILGVRFKNGAISSQSKLNAVNDADYYITDESGAWLNVSGKIIQNPLENKERFYETSVATGKTIVRGSTSNSGVASSKIYTQADVVGGSLTITEEGTIQGTFNNCTFYIDANEWNSTLTPQGLWLNFDNAKLYNCKIIVEDREKDLSGNFIPVKDATNNIISYKKAPDVNFYIKDGTSLELWGSSIITKYYYDEFFDSEAKKIVKELKVNTCPTDKRFVPGINIYGSNEEDVASKSHEIHFWNNSFISGYIIDPTATIAIHNAGQQSDKNIIYNDVNLGKQVLGIIGSAYGGGLAKEQGNDFTVLFISRDDGSFTDPGSSDRFNFRPIEGYSNYR